MFKLNPDPTFKASVKITVPGREPLPIEFEFKHKTRTGLDTWQKAMVRVEPDPTPDDPNRTKTVIKSDREVVEEYIVGWDGPINSSGDKEPWSVDAFFKVCENYHTAAAEVYVGYLKALTESRAKN